jgi:hypothetical protein
MIKNPLVFETPTGQRCTFTAYQEYIHVHVHEKSKTNFGVHTTIGEIQESFQDWESSSLQKIANLTLEQAEVLFKWSKELHGMYRHLAAAKQSSELIEVLRTAMEWDGEDNTGEPAVWYKDAERALDMVERESVQLNKDKRTGWLRDLKPGDEVGVVPSYDHAPFIATVKNITPTGRIRIKTERYEQSFSHDGYETMLSAAFASRLVPCEDLKVLIERNNEKQAIEQAFRFASESTDFITISPDRQFANQILSLWGEVEELRKKIKDVIVDKKRAEKEIHDAQRSVYTKVKK